MFYSYIGTKCQFLLKYKLTPVISTEGAFRRAVTYDNHPTHPHIALKTTSHELRRSKMHYDALRCTEIQSGVLIIKGWAIP